MEFVAIDFETANASRDSACSIGIVTIKNGNVIDEYYSLIRPKTLYFDPDNISVHNITQDMVLDKPNFEQLWPEIFPRLHNKQVAAHFAKFDMNVLRSTLYAYYLPLPTFDFMCSWQLSKKVFPSLPHYSLDCVAEHIGFKFQHHNALDDARACAAIISKALEQNPVQDFSHLADLYHLKSGKMYRTGLDLCEPNKNEQKEQEIELSLF